MTYSIMKLFSFLVVKCPGGCYNNTCCDTKTGNCKIHVGPGGDNCAGKWCCMINIWYLWK